MVDFKVKTQAIQDTTLHAAYPDLYDGTSPYLKVGGDFEPKKALIRFSVADKPTYGAAELKGGEVGFYTTGLTGSVSFPTFNMYKLKTGPNDANTWSGDGRIRTVSRGKQIVGITVTTGGTETGSYVKVLNHGLNTGDRIYHTPFTDQYYDVTLAGITPEIEYYVIRIDRDNFAFATSIDNAQAGTRLTLDAYSSNNYVPDPSVGESPDGPWGYVRSEVYSQDIHIITAKPKGSQTIAENFDGSEYRETNLNFESVARNLVRKTNPHVTKGSVLWDKPEGENIEDEQGNEGAWRIESSSNLKKWYGDKQPDDTYKIYLTDYESKSDGTGWWETEKDAGKWKGGYEYVPKTIPPTSLNINPAVKFDTELMTPSAEAYGDEVTPANSIFHVVKGAAEYSSAPPEGEGDNVLDATGAIRFSSEQKLTGGQACNMYSFWKKTATAVDYPEKKQESYMLYKGLPMPTVNFGHMDYALFGHGIFPLTASEPNNYHYNYGSADWTLAIKINFKKLEKAYIIGEDAGEDTVTARRGFHVILASSPPITGENFYDYCYRLSNGGSWNNAGSTDGHGVGFSIMNTTTGIVDDASTMKVFPLSSSTFDTANKDVRWQNEHHENDATKKSGYGGPGEVTLMQEDEWYDIKIALPPDTASKAALWIENADGQNITKYAKPYVEEDGEAIILSDFGNTSTEGILYGRSTSSDTSAYADKWWQHLSIWSTNTVSEYASTGSGLGTDWMAGEEDRDTESNIFIDNISLSGVNLGHSNATVNQVGRTARSTISITGSETFQTSHEAGDMHGSNFNSKGEKSNTRRSDNIILLGFEDPSQISSAYDIEPSWRYMFWNGYSSANLASDNKITFTAGDTLPSTSEVKSNLQPVSDLNWFNAVSSASTGTNWQRFTDVGWNIFWMLGGTLMGAGTIDKHIAMASYADAGMPIAWSDNLSLDTMSPTSLAFYSDGHHSPGGLFSNEVMTMRNLYINKTLKIADSTNAGLLDKGLYGSEQSMFSMCPSIGAVISPTTTDISGGVITIENGPRGGDGQFWRTGQPVVYYNNLNEDIDGLTSASGDFTDVPSGTSTGKYFIIKNAGTGISGVVITASGSGYTSLPTVSFSGGGGSDAAGTVLNSSTATAHVNNGSPSSSTTIIVDNVQDTIVVGMVLTYTGYTSGATVIAIPDSTHVTISTALNIPDNTKITFTSWIPTHILMTNTGTGYTSAPTVSFSAAGGSGAAGTATRQGLRAFELASSEINALAGTAITPPPNDSTTTGRHIFYDYDYYVNRKYFIDGFSSKGLSRMILQPTSYKRSTDATTKVIVPQFLPPEHAIYSRWDAPFGGDERFEDAGGNSLTGDTISSTQALLTKRENFACAAKVLEVLDQPNQNNPSLITLRVDTTEPLYSVPGTKYRLFTIAEPNSAASFKSDMTISIINKETIQVHNWNGKSDGDVTMWNHTGEDNARDSTLSRLWIGPEKYWVGMLIRNQGGYNAATSGTLPNKTYASICMVSPSGGEREGFNNGVATSINGKGQSALYPAWGIPGATYNESTYNADKVSGIRGAYINQWSPSPNLNPNETIYDLQDFGYGGPTEDKDNSGVENNVLGGYAARFIPRTGQINKVKIPALFNIGDQKEEGDTVDIAIQTESANNPSIMSIASIDNNTYPKPFLLTVFEDAMPEPPLDLEVVPKEEDEFLPEFTWTAGDADLWYGFIIIDDRPINNQYHHSLLHVPLNEDLRTVATSYDDTKGYYYASIISPVVYGHRYENTTVTPSGVHAGSALASAGTVKVSAVGVNLYDNEEGLAGNTKYFTSGSYAEFNYNTTGASSDFSYPVDEMSVLVHITPTSWGANRYIASFNVSTDTTTTKDSWGIYMDANGQINAFVSASDGDYTTHQTTHTELKSTTKVPIDGTPTSIILTVDTQLHSGNVKLYINGKLEDQLGLRGSLSINNWPTDTTGLGGYPIFQLKNVSYDESLFIGAKAQNGSSVGQNSFEGKIEEFVWYDKCIYPVTPQDGKFTLEKPIKELVTGAVSASSKAYTARLFIKDYHNIRGKTTGEVAASSQVSFKKAAFSLYT